MGPVRELRVAVTAENYEEALAFYRDALGLPVVESWENEGGSGAILDAGRATLEVLSRSQVDYLDEIEAGGTPSGPVRFALEVEDSVASAEVLEAAGAERLGGPVVTPWQHRNVRLRAPDGMQLTLFTVLD
ncbi:MAG TPA: VOC family protein [Gaiellaceae bacterium]|nr:VOC family protein [Gaiellaceae bacterium]